MEIELLSIAIPAAQAVSNAILQIYASSDFSIETKSDNSPVLGAAILFFSGLLGLVGLRRRELV